MGTNYIDIGSLAILSYFILTGIWFGFIKSAFSLVSFLAGITVVYLFTRPITDVINNIFLEQKDSIVVYIVTLIILFLSTTILVQYVGKLIHKAIKFAQLGLVNRLCGAGLGVIKSSILISIFLYCIDFAKQFNEEIENTLNESVSYRIYQKLPIDSVASPIENQLEIEQPPYENIIPEITHKSMISNTSNK